MHTTTYTEARANLARLLEEVESTREPVIIRRRGHDDAALLSAAELSSLMETAHLLRSPKNAQRLLAALQRAVTREGMAMSVDKLRRDTGFDQE